jgi:hypothetical protein
MKMKMKVKTLARLERFRHHSLHASLLLHRHPLELMAFIAVTYFLDNNSFVVAERDIRNAKTLKPFASIQDIKEGARVQAYWQASAEWLDAVAHTVSGELLFFLSFLSFHFFFFFFFFLD